MALKYFIEEVLLYDSKDRIEISIKSGEWINYNEIKDDNEITSQDIVNISCSPDHYNEKLTWSIFLW